MSWRTLVELNHDYCPTSESEVTILGHALQNYMRSGDPRMLQDYCGIKFLASRHHSEPEFEIVV